MHRFSLIPLRAAFFSAAIACLAAPALAQTPPDILVGEGRHAVSTADVLAEVTPLSTLARSNVLASPETVLRIATDIYVRRLLGEQAVAQKLDQAPQVQRLLQIVRERVLADIVLKHQEAQNQPAAQALEALAQENYKVQTQRFQQAERVHVRHILIPADASDARAQAQALRQRLVEGADFATLAKEHSNDTASASKGGDLGFITQGQMVAPFEEAAFALQNPGDLSPVVESRFGFHVIQLDEKRPAGRQAFDEVKDQLIQDATSILAKQTRQQLVDPLVGKATPHAASIESFSASYRK